MTSGERQKSTLSAEHARLAEGSAAAAGGDWKLIGPYLAERAWAPCARTTALTATPGGIFRSITRSHAPTAGARTAWRALAIASSVSVSLSRLGTGATPS